ncbi:MAG: addiction module protein [Betaproteobacteria bacterium]|nr:addiction module protein [Betaproteobacteria bacterium]
MALGTLTELLKLSPGERAELAMALWESLDDAQREAELALTPDQAAELDRRLADHLADPGSAVSWDEVCRKLTTKT